MGLPAVPEGSPPSLQPSVTLAPWPARKAKACALASGYSALIRLMKSWASAAVRASPNTHTKREFTTTVSTRTSPAGIGYPDMGLS